MFSAGTVNVLFWEVTGKAHTTNEINLMIREFYQNMSSNPLKFKWNITWRETCANIVMTGNFTVVTQNSFEPQHDKTNKMSVRPAKTQISLDIRPVWSESSLCAQWVAKDLRFLHADSEDSDQTGQMPRLIWVFAGRTATLLVLSCRGSFTVVIKSAISSYTSMYNFVCLMDDEMFRKHNMIQCLHTEMWLWPYHMTIDNTK